MNESVVQDFTSLNLTATKRYNFLTRTACNVTETYFQKGQAKCERIGRD